MNEVSEALVSKVKIGGQMVDLGQETTVTEAVSMLENLGMMDYIHGTEQVVQGDVLSFVQQNGEKGVA